MIALVRTRPVLHGILAGIALLLVLALAIGPTSDLGGRQLRVVVALVALVLSFSETRRPRERWRVRFVAPALAVVALGAYYKLASPLGHVHEHDLVHYYLGSKYQPELGYTRLYDCLVAAEGDLGAPPEEDRRIRDLDTLAIVTTKEIAPRAVECRGRFAPERWRSFVGDVELLRGQFTPKSWRALYLDHGYTPPPIATLERRPLASLAPASRGFLEVLVGVDLVLLALALALVGWAFGLRVLCVAIVFFACEHPANSDWLRGNFLRQDWLFGVVSAVCFLRRGRHALGGAMLGVAAALRIFPVALLAGPLLAFVVRRWRRRGRRRADRATRRLIAGAAATLIGLTALSAAVLGPAHLREFARHVAVHAEVPGANHVGVPVLLMYDPSGRQEATIDVTLADPVAAWRAARVEQLRSLRPVHVVIVLAVVGAMVAALRRRRALWLSVVLSTTVVFATFQVACYYMVLFLLVPLASRLYPKVERLVLAAALASAIAAVMPAFSDSITDEYATQTVILSALCVGCLLMAARARTAPRASEDVR